MAKPPCSAKAAASRAPCKDANDHKRVLVVHIVDGGDTLVVWKLDRLSRSPKDLLTILERVSAAGAKFRSLTESIDTSGPAGRMLMQMLGSFAEFEREMIRERTRAGLHEARAQGRVPGRKPKITAEQKKEIVEAVSSGRKTPAEIVRLLKIHRATVSRIVSQARVRV